MRTYFSCILIVALLLCGCTAQPAETVPPTTESIPETTEAEALWVPYDGNSKHYTYRYTSERDMAWEEDILFFGDSYLSEYPLLTHFPSRIEYGIEVEYSDRFYDPEMRQSFIDQINDLIEQIPDLSDTEILYGLQRILAQLKDAHTSLGIEWNDVYPIGFQEFREGDDAIFYVTLVPEEYEYTILYTLSGVNGIPLDEVIERLAPYVSTENQYFLFNTISGGSQLGLLANRDLLELTGIADGPSAVYNLITPRGHAFDITVNSCSFEEAKSMDYVGHTHPGVYPDIYGGEDHPSYFYRWMEEDRMMYVRVNQFFSMYDYSFYALGNDVMRELREIDGTKKLVVDLRRNPGGYQFQGFVEFIDAMSRMEYDQLYILIDEGTFSGGILMAGQIKSKFPEATLAGTPAGQPPNFFANNNDTDYVLPNSGVTCRMPTAFLCVFPEYEYDALMPDLVVYPTVEDYMLCIDTILEAVKAQ